jgi:trans-aconitate methyltransferase
VRTQSYGQKKPLGILDKLGELLSGRNLRISLRATRRFNSIADIGSGYSGNLTKPYWKRFKEVHLFDFKLDVENLSALHPGIYFHEGDVSLLLINDKYNFDLIVLNNVLEHIENPVELLEKLYCMQSPQSVMYINVPSWTGKYFLEKAAFKFKLAPREEMEDHKRYYSKRDLWLEVRKAGFMPSKIEVRRNKFGLNVTALVTK